MSSQEELDRRVSKHETDIAEIITAIRQFMALPVPKAKRPIGFAPRKGRG